MKFMDTWADSPDRCHRIANLMFYEDLSLEDAVEKERSEQLLYDTPRDQIELRHQVNLEWESNYSIDLTESFDALEERQSFAHATSPAKDDQSAFGKNDVHVRVRTVIESAVSDWEDISDTSISEVASPKHPQATNTDVGRQHLGYLEPRTPSTCLFQRCGRTFYNSNHFRKHLYTHQPKSQTCPICYKRFSREDAVSRHLMQRHNQSKETAKELARANHVPIHTPTEGPELGGNSMYKWPRNQ